MECCVSNPKLIIDIGAASPNRENKTTEMQLSLVLFEISPYSPRADSTNS